MLMTVTVKPGSAVEVGAPVSLFKTEIAGVGPTDPWGYDRQYTVTRDGQRFLINTVAEPTRALPMTIVFNWPTALNHR